MKTHHKIAVIGGGGRTGKYLVNQLLDRGFQIKLLLRNPEISKQIIPLQNPAIQVVEGDVLNYEAVCSLIEGCDAVISTVGQRKDEPLVASHATANILKAISESANREVIAKRYILVAGINVDTPIDKKSAETLAATEWMKSNFPIIHEDRQKAYEILKESDAAWTLVRVPFIVFTDDQSEVGVSLKDSPGQKISAASIAGFLIDQLSDENYIRKAPFIANV